jgi:hypothetical protein
MPQATLTFNLPDDSIEHLQAVHAGAAFAALHELDQEMRLIYKHGTQDSIEDVMERLRRIISQVTWMTEQ